MITLTSFLIDLILGDPENLPHPVRLMGKTIIFLEDYFRNFIKNSFVAGFIFATILILSSFGITFLIISLSNYIHPLLKMISEIILIYYCISIKSLQTAALDVYNALKQNNLKLAREKVSYIVGRETEKLSESGVARAAVETVAENLVDGIISPLFYAMIGGAPLAIAYKMVNTLDSMIGYKNEKYIKFGKTAARIDDAANFIPARLSIFIISIASHLFFRKGADCFKTAIKDGNKHLSPNSGYSEAAFAGALSVKLGGPNYYHGKLVYKPYIGESFSEVTTEHIKSACDLMLLSSFLFIIIIIII
ncbi:MAG: cobalamin biosynthesis protein CobD [Desulfobacterales bacterium]|nr:cobalamin biosynthesis protein CobD [Desulfobacterales bacterium]